MQLLLVICQRRVEKLAFAGKNGLLFDGNSPEELANAISALISDPALCSAIGIKSSP